MVNVLRKFLFKGRWFVKVEGRSGSMPFANHVWLEGNPSFSDIPKDYVIHHLDGDAVNDDISNLALMQKHHHAAHHFKQKKIQSKVEIDYKDIGTKRTTFFPTREPVIEHHRDNLYRLRFPEVFSGKRHVTYLYSWEGISLKTMEAAQIAKQKIWNKK